MIICSYNKREHVLFWMKKAKFASLHSNVGYSFASLSFLSQISKNHKKNSYNKISRVISVKSKWNGDFQLGQFVHLFAS